MKQIIVIGAGASGIMAAGQAAMAGGSVLLLEKTDKPGSKILISGQGRCNLTNSAPVQEFLNHFNRSGRFLHQPFARFFVPQLLDFFERLGMETVTERGGRVFPASGKAREVVTTLLRWLASTGARLECGQTVTDIATSDTGIIGVHCGRRFIAGDAVILATGGASYPATGSSGDGYSFASRCGHTIVTPRPALVPLVTDNSRFRDLAGLDLRNCGVRIYCGNKRKVNDFGEVGFTRFGIGGPVILTHSRDIGDWLRAGQEVTIALDLKPALDDRKLDARLQRDFQQRASEELESVLRGLLPKQLVSVCLQLIELDGAKPAGRVTAAERTRLRGWLKDFRITVTDQRPLKEAIVTAGGVDVREVNPQTMESRLVPGLYLCGEVLDIDGDTGGYNLQAAFSTGWLAGRSAAAD